MCPSFVVLTQFYWLPEHPNIPDVRGGCDRYPAVVYFQPRNPLCSRLGNSEFENIMTSPNYRSLEYNP